MSIYQKLTAFFSKGNRANWCLFLLFAGILLLKEVLFHWFAFHSIVISSLWTSPYNFYFTYASIFAPILILSVGVFFIKSHVWTMVIMWIIDFWIVANLMYYNANELFVSIHSILMVNNLQGFTTSIFALFHWEYLLFPCLSIMYMLCAMLLPKLPKRRCWNGIGIIILGYILLCTSSYRMRWIYMYRNQDNPDFNYKNNDGPSKIGYKGIKCFIPFHSAFYCYESPSGYIYTNGIIPYSVASVIMYFTQEDETTIEHPRQEDVKDLLHAQRETIKTSKNLLLILVESLESWPIGRYDDRGKEITPNLSRIISSKQVNYFSHIQSQAKHGVSIDGQMIVQTGLLPISSGAAAVLYQQNMYPSYADCFDDSFMEAVSNTYNQDTIAVRFGYKHLAYPETLPTDAYMVHQIINRVRMMPDSVSWCLLGMTISSHLPFKRINDPVLYFEDETPKVLVDYLNCVHYTDSCLGILFDEMQTWKNIDVVITADHSVFKKGYLDDFQSYAKEKGISQLANKKTYIPLIVYSSDIKQNKSIDEVCYQMDIYPTILHLIGCEDYYWKGFGVNLLDSTARHNRPITEEEAYQLSDKLIRADYFREIVDSLEIANTKQL